jgi:hypothetical protein
MVSQVSIYKALLSGNQIAISCKGKVDDLNDFMLGGKVDDFNNFMLGEEMKL